MERRVQASVAAAVSKRAHAEVDYDSDIEVLEEMSSRENPTGRRSLLNDMKPAAKPSPAKTRKGCSEDFSNMFKKQLEEKCDEYCLPKNQGPNQISFQDFKVLIHLSYWFDGSNQANTYLRSTMVLQQPC
jgi:hypothetical protein|mmetsp:Transcript_16499/g.29783  ORF Transcript_16499/g.29783 Transcript_16499/m.29783 type:complete len:130 (+) Transcript_16499:2811-3200(+)